MKLKEVLKGLILILSLITITSCESHKHNGNRKTSNVDINTVHSTYSTGLKDGKIFYNEQANLQIQKLQQNNIIYFGLNRYDIHHDFDRILDSHAIFLRNHPSYKVIIEGHTDERGTPEYNIALGERRANAIKIYLQSKGVSIDQMSIVSYGKEKPAILGHDESAYFRNRRAVLEY